MPDYVQKAFKDALAKVPQRILWKYEGEMEGAPKNVMIKKWFPQRDILCKLYFNLNDCKKLGTVYYFHFQYILKLNYSSVMEAYLVSTKQ